MKLIKIFTISIFIIILLTQNIFAMGEVMSDGESFMATGKEHAGIGMSSSALKDASNKLYYTLLAVATCVAVIVGAMLAIKYMTAGISEKVEVKETLFPYLISCIVVFGSLGIWKLVVTIMSSLT